MATRSANKLPRLGRAAIKRSFQHLNSDKVLLNENVQQMKIVAGRNSRGSFGARQVFFMYFYYDKVPQLKFHNPSVLFSKSKGDVSAIVVELNDGNMKTLDIQGKDPEEILQCVKDKFAFTDTKQSPNAK
ncbi:28S ribosomal protein S25, mitochondrial [Trichoplax sp. H2]|nr:28S ribosomal protein S25, mitochondrial [Trichoplax sp. H2]|eukprot:RDD45997.1 28S ribosomal protein S25, mitochondrial [Trichoplax sp. H2]